MVITPCVLGGVTTKDDAIDDCKAATQELKSEGVESVVQVPAIFIVSEAIISAPPFVNTPLYDMVIVVLAIKYWVIAVAIADWAKAGVALEYCEPSCPIAPCKLVSIRFAKVVLLILVAYYC